MFVVILKPSSSCLRRAPNSNPRGRVVPVIFFWVITVRNVSQEVSTTCLFNIDQRDHRMRC
jgi:hypothetical protein